MSLQLVYGPAGSGKSTQMQERIIKEAIENPSKQFLLIVPDQFTMQTQMDMVKRHPNGGIMNIDVLSFSRLSYRVFSETGRPDYSILDDTGKSLVLRHVASLVAEKMPYIGKNLNKIGYINEVKSMISEFMQYGISVKDVAKLSNELSDDLLKIKINDLSVIYEAFCDYNRDRFITSEETLDILCSRLGDASFVKGAHIVFDGFTGFTPIQEKVILKLLELADKVTVTLTLSAPETPGETGSEEKLFYLTRTTGNRLVSLAKNNKITVDTYEMISGENGRFAGNSEIRHLESNLFRPIFEKYTDKPENLQIFYCDNIGNEVNEITLKIHDLVRTGKYAYRDIAVVAGSLDTYGDLFDTRMKELDIPCFIDRTQSIVLNPFIEYLKSALQIVIKDFSYDSVFHYLKSGFAEYDSDTVDRFGKYAESLNLRGKTRYSRELKKIQRGMDSKFALAELPTHEETRKQLYNEISVLLKPAETAAEYVTNLYEFLKLNDSYRRLHDYEVMFEQENNLTKAKEYGQIYRLVMELLDTIYNLIGSEKMDIKEFYRIFEAGINEIQVGLIPKNVDRVLVGDIERTRLNEIKVLFFAGVNEGNIPKASETTGILSNREREIITSHNYDLSPTDKTKIYTQRLYLYSNLCKPKEKLFISYACTDREGKGLKPSYLITTLRRIFPELNVEAVDNRLSIERMVNLKDSYSFYSKLVKQYSMNSLTDAEKTLTECLLRLYNEEESAISGEITDAAFKEYISTALPREIVKLIYGETIRGSISRMEKYAKCAYSHFLSYGVGLQDKADAEFNALDMGNVYHAILESFAKELENRGLSFESFTDEEGKEILHACVTRYCEDYEQGILNDNEQTQYIITKITRIMERTIFTIRYQVGKGEFRPKMNEYSFSRQIPLDDGMMELKGRIDRVDLYSEGDRIFVRIVDYKSGGKTLDVTNIYHGLEQQLPLYLAEAMYHEKRLNPDKEIIPAALFYYQVTDPIIDAERNRSDEEIETGIHKKLAFTGMLNSDLEVMKLMDRDVEDKSTVLPVSFYKNGNMNGGKNNVLTVEEMQKMTEYTEKLVTSIGNRINGGDISVSPMKGGKDACSMCSFKAICRFDPKIPGFKERDGKEIDTEEIKERLFGGKEDGLYLFD